MISDGKIVCGICGHPWNEVRPGNWVHPTCVTSSTSMVLTPEHQKALDKIADLERKLALCVETLEQLQLGHSHNEKDSNYRPLGDTYGWCSLCSTKVGLNEDIARSTLAALSQPLKEGEK